MLTDKPGRSAGPPIVTRHDFEDVALGLDTQFVYGSLKWGFEIHPGKIVEKQPVAQATASATFGEALERHGDYYVHEAMTFYFDFDSAFFLPDEEMKILPLLPYLDGNPDVQLFLDGFADKTEGGDGFNQGIELAGARAAAVRATLIEFGVRPDRIARGTSTFGASTAATPDAGTGDQGGESNLGMDPLREANCWPNRRVLLTFSRDPDDRPNPLAQW
jgi:outer membrane protein OmpA-like peptidoglycan-associated protein